MKKLVMSGVLTFAVGLMSATYAQPGWARSLLFDGNPLGDMNCDGLFNGGDIDPFFVGLGDPALWEITFPFCDLLESGDMNGDGAMNGGDIDPFFVCLVGGGCS